MNLAMLGQVTPIRGCPISGREKCACNCDTGQKQYIYIIFIYNYFSRGNSIHSLSLSLPHRPHSDWAAIHSPSHGVHVHVGKYCRFFFQTTTTESNKKDKKDIHIVITHSRRKKMIEQHDLVTKTTETQLVGRKEFKHLISSY